MGGAAKKIHLVQLAGGQGTRVGGETPKQFLETGWGPLFAVSLREFLKLTPEVGKVVSVTVTVAESWAQFVADTLGQLGLSADSVFLAEPGASRTESTWSALKHLARLGNPQPEDLVAVHDAARPFASAQLLENLVLAAGENGAAVPGIPVSDTILQVPSGAGTAGYLQRDSLVAVQTPQVFTWDRLHSAHQWAAVKGESFTDDGSLVAYRGKDPLVVPGEQGNWKVTTSDDWQRARLLLSKQSPA